MASVFERVGYLPTCFLEVRRTAARPRHALWRGKSRVGQAGFLITVKFHADFCHILQKPILQETLEQIGHKGRLATRRTCFSILVKSLLKNRLLGNIASNMYK